MNKIFKRLGVFIIMIMMVVGGTFTSFASNNPLQDICTKLEAYEGAKESNKQGAYEEAVREWNALSGSVLGDVDVVFAGTRKYFTNTSTNVSSATSDPNYIAAYTKLSSIIEGSTSSDTEGKVANTADAKKQLSKMSDIMGANADIVGGAKSLESITPLVSQLTGSMVVIVLIGLSIFTAFDVFYLVMPVAKNKMDSAAQSGTKMATRTDKSTGEAKFRWVTDDAIAAYEEGSQSGKNPLFSYLKKRTISYIAVAIVVFILMTGNVSMIVNFVLQMLTSLFDMFSSLTRGL